MAGAVGAFASRLATSFVALDQGAAEDRFQRRQLAQESVAALSQCGTGLGSHPCQTTYITGLIVIEVNTYFNLFVWVWLVPPVARPTPKATGHRAVVGGDRVNRTETDRPSRSIRVQRRSCRAPTRGGLECPHLLCVVS